MVDFVTLLGSPEIETFPSGSGWGETEVQLVGFRPEAIKLPLDAFIREHIPDNSQDRVNVDLMSKIDRDFGSQECQELVLFYRALSRLSQTQSEVTNRPNIPRTRSKIDPFQSSPLGMRGPSVGAASFESGEDTELDKYAYVSMARYEEETASIETESISYITAEDTHESPEVVETPTGRLNHESDILPLSPLQTYQDQGMNLQTPEERPFIAQPPPLRRKQRPKVTFEVPDESSSDGSSFDKFESPLARRSRDSRYSSLPNPIMAELQMLSTPNPTVDVSFLDLPLPSSSTSGDSTYHEISSQHSVNQNSSPSLGQKDQAEDNTNHMVTILLDYICKDLSALSGFTSNLSCCSPSTSLLLNVDGNMVRTRPDLQISLERNDELMAILDYEVRIYPGLRNKAVCAC